VRPEPTKYYILKQDYNRIIGDSLPFDFEKESIQMAVRSIRERKLRSVLTVTGIVIGIAAIISLVSISEGTSRYIQEQFEQFGANKIIVMPSMSGGMGTISAAQSLSEKDIDIIKRVRGVDTALPILSKSLQAEYKDVTTMISIMGVNSKEAEEFFSDIQSFDLSSGRFPRAGDKYVVVVGSLVAESAFEKELRIRDKLVIKEKTFDIIGILKEIGNTQDDSMIMMPLDTMRDITGEEDEISFIMASANDASNVDRVAELIEQRLDNKYGEKSFMVLSTSSLAGQISSITNTLSFVLGGIAGISLLVAGIGIANTMYMSILERTKEIGIMKSIGATGRNILYIFLTEAAIIGLIGGIIGITVGTTMSQIIGIALESYGMPLKTVVTPELAILGLSFSVGVGVLSGFMPARKAAMLNPIEALRYE